MASHPSSEIVEAQAIADRRVRDAWSAVLREEFVRTALREPDDGTALWTAKRFPDR
jgi:protein-L-isoaspartate O-methyltransferase